MEPSRKRRSGGWEAAGVDGDLSEYVDAQATDAEVAGSSSAMHREVQSIRAWTTGARSAVL